MSYVKFDQAIELIQQLGAKAWMCKFDIEDAFKQVPIHPSLWHLHGVQWRNQMFFFTRLVFGCRSSPKIFDNLSTAICWIAENLYEVKHILHLLDDFLTVDAPNCDGNRNMTRMKMLFDCLGVPLSLKKTVGPTYCLEYLGIILDSNLMQARLPQNKIQRICAEIQEFLHRKSSTKRQLLSLLGHLQFASRVIPPGRSFISQLILLSTTVKELTQLVYLNLDSRAELAMWLHFLSQWNGVSLFMDRKISVAADMELYTDASSTLGFGGYYQGQWFSSPWPSDLSTTSKRSLALLELYPIVVSALIWGHTWRKKRILFHCDNLATVHIIRKGRAKAKCVLLNQLMRRLTLSAMENNCLIIAQHVPGRNNSIADALSRFQLQRFRHLAPMAASNPTKVPRFKEVCQVYKQK